MNNSKKTILISTTWIISCLLSSFIQAAWSWNAFQQIDAFDLSWGDYFKMVVIYIIPITLFTLIPFLLILATTLYKKTALESLVFFVSVSLLSFYSIYTLEFGLNRFLSAVAPFILLYTFVKIYIRHAPNKQKPEDTSILDDGL